MRGGERPQLLLKHVEQTLRQQHIVLPGVTVLEKLIRSARNHTEESIYQELNQRIDDSTREKIGGLLQAKEPQSVATFQKLRAASRGPSTDALEREIDALECVREILSDFVDLSDVHPSLLERLANIVSGMPTQAVLQFGESKRIALLFCWLWRLRTQITDTALTITNDLIAGVLRRAKKHAEIAYKHQQKRVGPVLKVGGDVLRAVLDKEIPDAQVHTEIVSRWSEQQLQTIAQECQELGHSRDDLYMEELRKRHAYVRQFAPRLPDTFALKSVSPCEPLLKAVDYLRECNRQERRFRQEDAPVEFVPAKWKSYVSPQPGTVDRALWEIGCVAKIAFQV